MFARLRSLLKAKAAAPVEQPVHLKQRGDECLRQGRLDEAASFYKQALVLEPGHVDTQVALGFALAELGQHAEAQTQLLLALSAAPGMADAHYILATLATRQGDRRAAMEHLERALVAKPELEFAHRDLIDLLFQAGDTAQAKLAAQRAVAAFPQAAEFQFYFATALAQEQAYEQAIACYQQALQLQPDAVVAHSALGELLERTGQLKQARDTYRQAAQLAPDNPTVQLRLGLVLQKLGRFADALVCFRRITVLSPQDAAAHQHVGNTLLRLGAADDALESFKQVVRLQPDNPVSHLVAALSGQAPDHPPSDYVAQLFDGYAEGFEAHLVASLRYDIPTKLAALLQAQAVAVPPPWRVLDLGCGTGLVGKALQPWASQLVGVDLSTGMLAKARDLNLYHRLQHMDVHAALVAEADDSFDVVTAADVFIYVGKLDDLVPQVGRVVRPGGLFSFSLESQEVAAQPGAPGAEPPGYVLCASGRYAHSLAYMDLLAQRHGFEVLQTQATPLRLDRGRPVPGHIALWRRR